MTTKEKELEVALSTLASAVDEARMASKRDIQLVINSHIVRLKEGETLLCSGTVPVSRELMKLTIPKHVHVKIPFASAVQYSRHVNAIDPHGVAVIRACQEAVAKYVE